MLAVYFALQIFFENLVFTVNSVSKRQFYTDVFFSEHITKAVKLNVFTDDVVEYVEINSKI